MRLIKKGRRVEWEWREENSICKLLRIAKTGGMDPSIRLFLILLSWGKMKSISEKRRGEKLEMK